MIYFFSQNGYILENKKKTLQWIINTIKEENYKIGLINIIFCDDEFLLNINKKFLHHDYYTDIITFDYSKHDILSGELYLSIDRIYDYTKESKVIFIEELHRVIIHGILHLCGYTDKFDNEKIIMMIQENKYLNIFLMSLL